MKRAKQDIEKIQLNEKNKKRQLHETNIIKRNKKNIKSLQKGLNTIELMPDMGSSKKSCLKGI